jgi:acetyl-CoA synthetase
MAAVVGVPDPVRTEVVKAFLVLKSGVPGTEALKSELQEFVRTRLAAHEYPRMVEFRDSLPLTATGKIIRRALRNPSG